MLLVSSCSCFCPIHWSQVLSREWRCSNYIWVIDNFVAYKGASYIRDLTVLKVEQDWLMDGIDFLSDTPLYWGDFIRVFGMCIIMGSANESRRYIVTPPLIGWAHTHNDPCTFTVLNTVIVCTINTYEKLIAKVILYFVVLPRICQQIAVACYCCELLLQLR